MDLKRPFSSGKKFTELQIYLTKYFILPSADTLLSFKLFKFPIEMVLTMFFEKADSMTLHMSLKELTGLKTVLKRYVELIFNGRDYLHYE
jgi:hypothetical protein